MANSTNQVLGDVIDAIRPDLEAFASLWAALRANYEGTNITKTIARLLHMYQPEDGIQAYERLLKTLFVLLEDFDGNGLRLLVSMVPPPKGSSDEITKDVFFKATGFVRIDAPIFYQNYPLISFVTNPIDSEIMKENNAMNIALSVREKIPTKSKNGDTSEVFSQRSESPQVISQGYYPFRGFSQTEIGFSQREKVQPTAYNLPTDAKSYLKCEQTPGQCFVDRQGDSSSLPVSGYKMNWVQAPLLLQNGRSLQSNPSYRDLLVKTMNNKYLRVPVAHCNPSNMHYFTRPYQFVSTSRKMQSKAKNPTTTSGLVRNSSATQVSGALNHVKQEDRHRNEGVVNEGRYPNLSEHNYGLPKNEEVKQGSEQSKMHALNCENKKSTSIEEYTLKNLTVGIDLATCIERFINRAKQGASSNAKKSKADNPEPSNIVSERTTNMNHQGKKFEKNSLNGFREKNNLQNGSNDASYNFGYQPNSMAELAAHKRQYYDTLLSIQRAKMAVANSLTLSPMQSCNDYDSYHPDYWLYQHPQRLLMGQSYGQRYVQHNDWMSSYPSSLMSQETPLIHSSAIFNSRFMYSSQESTVQAQGFASSETKIEAKKRKLENIVVKLKEGEMNGIQN